MRRRAFIAILSSAAAWPFTAVAQQAAPVIGYLNGASAAHIFLRHSTKGLAEAGFAEARNLKIEYRYADGHYDRLAALAADLVERKVSVIVATAGTPTIIAVKAATSNIPIVFVIGGDPVRFGLVASVNRPGGNVTGITVFGIELAAKRLELLLELVPAAKTIGVLANPDNPITAPQLAKPPRTTSADNLLSQGPAQTLTWRQLRQPLMLMRLWSLPTRSSTIDAPKLCHSSHD